MKNAETERRLHRMNNTFKLDYYRMTGKTWGAKALLHILDRYDLRYLWFYRRYQNKKNRLEGLILKLQKDRWRKKYGLDIHTTDIGEGLYLGHAHNINVNIF